MGPEKEHYHTPHFTSSLKSLKPDRLMYLSVSLSFSSHRIIEIKTFNGIFHFMYCFFFCLLWCIHMYMKNQQSWPEPNKFCCEQHFPRSITLSNLDFLVCCICLHSTFTYLTIGLLGSSINLFCIVCILHEKSTVLSWSK